MPDAESAGTGRLPVSAIITTYNEEHNIEDCIASLEWCDEILVVDSYSTDRTQELVRKYPAVKLLEHTYHGSAAQKNWAMDRTTHDWILIFDADERCTPELRTEIEALLGSAPEHTSYSVRRRLYFLDKLIRFCGWHRDTVVRLVKRGEARYPNRRVHADMMTSGPSPMLQHALDHYMVFDIAEYIQRITKYGVWGASQCWKEGRTSGPLEFVGRPLWRFFRSYGLQLGFLDGRHGLIFCVLQAYGTFVKWSVLWGWRVGAKLGREPNLPTFDDSQETWAGLDELGSGKKA